MQHRIKVAAAAIAAAVLAASAGYCASSAEEAKSEAKGTIEEFQQKVNKIAAEKGIPAPDIKKVLESENKHQQELAKARANFKESPIEGIVEIEADKVRVIQGKDGRLLYLIGGGRFALTGTLIDVWERKTLTSLKSIAEAKSRMNLKALGLDVTKLNTIVVGSGKEVATVIVDPRCSWCHQLLREMLEGADLSAKGSDGNSLLSKYTFHIVVAGIMGQRSKELAAKIACAQASDREKLDALYKGPEAIDKLKQIEKCDNKRVSLTDLNMQVMGIRGVPVVVAPDYRYQRGKPVSLEAFLSGKDPGAVDDPAALADLAREQARQIIQEQNKK